MLNISMRLDRPDTPKWIINVSYHMRDKIPDSKCDPLFDFFDEQIKIMNASDIVDLIWTWRAGLRGDFTQH